MKQETIVIKNLQKSYGDNIVTDNLSVTFYSGEIVAVVGHNGAGKTTFLNQLNGLVASDGGFIYIGGIDVTNHPSKARKLVSSMPQFQVPLKGVTVKESIECIGALKGMKSAEIKLASKQLINYLSIENWKNVTGEKLSGGLQRLTSFAMSVVDNPSVILLDEPTNDVDPFRRMLIWRYLRQMANGGSTVIIVTHNLLEVERYADRYLLMEKGRIKRDVNVSDKQHHRSFLHQVSLSILDEDIVEQFLQEEYSRYDSLEKRLSFVVKDQALGDLIPTILDYLKTDKILSYEIKPKNLSDDYEEYLDEQ